MPKVADQWLRDILLFLSQRRTSTRTEILEATEINAASVSHALRFLMGVGVVIKVGERDSNGGRKQEVLKLNADERFLIAIDLEGMSIRFALTNLVGDIRCRWEEDVSFGRTLDVRRIHHGIERVLASLDSRQRSRVVCIGVSHPGFPAKDGRITAVNLGWSEFPLGEHLSRVSDLPVFFEDAHRTYVQAERWAGAGRNSDNFAYIIVGHGVGVGCIVDGHLLQGAAGAAGELGHITIDPSAPDLCHCGKRGCLEAIASSPNIVRQYLEKTARQGRKLDDIRVAAVYDAARRNESEAIEVVDRAARHLGLALSNLIQILNPELVVFGGDLIQAQDLFLPRIQAVLKETLLPKLAEQLHLTISSLGADIGLKGAATMAFQKCLAVVL